MEKDERQVAVVLGKFAEVSQILDRTQSTLHIDALLADIAGEMEADGREDIQREVFVQLLDSGHFGGKLETIQFFAFRFKWPWLRQELTNRLAEKVEVHDLRGARIYEAMLEAFEDDWEDRDLFPSLA